MMRVSEALFYRQGNKRQSQSSSQFSYSPGSVVCAYFVAFYAIDIHYT